MWVQRAGKGNRRAGSRLWLVFTLVFALVAGGCTGAATVERADPSGDALRVGAFNFLESELLAELYAQALEKRGLPVARLGPIGPREVVEPALELGLLDVVPEYAGTMLEFVNLGAGEANADTGQTVDKLRAALRPRGLIALEPALAQNRNVLVVRRLFAAEHEIRTISDLLPLAAALAFGGPVECPERFFCMIGLRERYGLEFASFIPMPSGAVVAEGLLSEEIDVGLLFSTDVVLVNPKLMALVDDRGLQPAENVIPVLSRDEVLRWGLDLTGALDVVSAHLTTERLVTLNVRASQPGADIGEMVKEWLKDRYRIG